LNLSLRRTDLMNIFITALDIILNQWKKNENYHWSFDCLNPDSIYKARRKLRKCFWQKWFHSRNPGTRQHHENFKSFLLWLPFQPYQLSVVCTNKPGLLVAESPYQRRKTRIKFYRIRHLHCKTKRQKAGWNCWTGPGTWNAFAFLYTHSYRR